MIKSCQGVLCCTLLLLLTGCASLNPDYQQPIVNVQSFRALPGQSAGLPEFEIGLQVLNPNPEPLNLEGVFYSISLQGQDLISGVSNDLPVIEGYGDGVINLKASVSVLGGIRLIQRLMNQPRDQVEYRLTARLDPAGFGRTVRVEESGVISLTGQ